MIQQSIKVEVNAIKKAEDLVKENPLFIKLVLQYTRYLLFNIVGQRNGNILEVFFDLFLKPF